MRRVLIVLSAALLTAVFVGAGATGAHGAGASPSQASKLTKLAARTWPHHGAVTPAAAPSVNAAAASNSVFQQDPAGDVSPSQDARADITDFGVAYGPSSIIAVVDVAQGTDPTTDPNWTGDTGPAWGFDTNADGTPEFVLVLVRDPSSPRMLGGVIRVSDQTVTCLAMVTWDGHNRYRASIGPACIGSPASVGVAAGFSYDTAPSDPNNTPFTDHAPDSSTANPPVFAGPIVSPGGNGWAAFEALASTPNGFDSAPDVAAWGTGRLDVFVRNGDGQLAHAFWDGSSWQGVEALGGQLAPGTGPGVAAWAPGRLDVFVTGTDGQLWHKWFDGAWSGYEPLGGQIVGGPDVASWADGRLDVLVRGTDNQLWHKWFDGAWHGYEPLGGVLASDPTAASWAEGRLDVFVRGTDNQLWHKWYDNGWHGYEPLGGALAGAPEAASWVEGRLDVFVRGTDNQLWHKWYDNGWHGYEPLGGALASDPTVASWAPGRLDVFAVSGDGALWHDWYPGG